MVLNMAKRQIYSQKEFRLRVLEEWRRSERSSRPEILILFNGMKSVTDSQEFFDRLTATFRGTDVFGWYRSNATFGVLLVELGKSSLREALKVVEDKIHRQVLCAADCASAGVSAELQVLPPYTFTGGDLGNSAGTVEELWKDIHENNWILTAITRALDISGSLLFLIFLSPCFLAIAFCIRLTTRGPALFRQRRVGLRGSTFELYKFRTMTVGNNDQAHREFMKQFINGNGKQHSDERGEGVFKITNDSRVTRVGQFLRRTSLDEIPQFWNVLRGDMSLVGPRPPLAYEVEHYDLWHRQRINESKPGITGLWQVHGRSRCTFDEMTRLDLKHAQTGSLALYLRVLLETPQAVIRGRGAH